jgi:hypothetical protein
MAALVDVGELLYAYAAAPEQERERRAAELRDKAKAARIRIAGDGPSTSAVGGLLVSSDPPGARILVDGKETTSTTPAVIDLPPGTTHDVGYRLDGFRDATRPAVQVLAGDTRRVHIELAPLLVHIQLASTPPGAAVFLDGKLACEKTPCVINRRPEDGYPVVVLRHPGCADYRTTIVLENEVDVPYAVRLDCRP